MRYRNFCRKDRIYSSTLVLDMLTLVIAGDIFCHFANRMSRGDVKAAIALLDSDDHTGAPMGLDVPLVSEDPSWTVCNELLKKHPKGQPANSAALKSLDGCGERFHAMHLMVP